MERSHPWPLVGQQADDDICVAPMLQRQMQETAGNTRGHGSGSQAQTTSQHSEQSNSPQWIQQQGMQEEAREAQHANGERDRERGGLHLTDVPTVDHADLRRYPAPDT